MYKKIANIQKKIGKMSKDKKGYNYMYYDINQLLEALMPLIEKEGLVLTQPLTSVDGKPAITTRLVNDKESMESTVILPDLQDAQKMGGAITYFRRYSLVSLFCLQAEDDDAKETKDKGDIPF